MKRLPLRLLAGILLCTATVVCLLFVPIKESLRRFLEWTQSLGAWGPMALAIAYVPACLLFFPGAILTIGAGFAFGVVRGTIAVSAGSVAGAATAFWVGRTLARAWIERRVAQSPRFRALDVAVAHEGFKIVFLTRLSPIFPFTVLNYAFGLTRVRFRDYVLASWIGMLPGTLLYVYIGSALQSLAEVETPTDDGGVTQKVLFWLGLAATFLVTVFVTRLARQALRTAVPETAPQGDTHA